MRYAKEFRRVRNPAVVTESARNFSHHPTKASRDSRQISPRRTSPVGRDTLLDHADLPFFRVCNMDSYVLYWCLHGTIDTFTQTYPVEQDSIRCVFVKVQDRIRQGKTR